MPSTYTITSFYTFSPKTKIKSSEHNSNFDNFRGHLIPIDPNTSTAAATMTYDLGCSEYRWNGSYSAFVDLYNADTTTSVPANPTAGATRIYPDGSNNLIRLDSSGNKRRVFDESLLSAKGDIVSASGVNSLTVLNVGSDNQFLVASSSTASGLAWKTLNSITSAPTIQKFTSGSGTYATPAGVKYIIVEMIGAGGGGGGSGTAVTSGGTGGSTTFGTSTAAGGTGATSYTGGDGGAGTVGSGLTGFAFSGGAGGAAYYNAAGTSQASGGNGGASAYGGNGRGGAGTGSSTGFAGSAGATNTGGGGGGGGCPSSSTSFAGAGGGAGGYVKLYINSPSSTYSYSIGTAGTAGSAGSGGSAGGAGGSGIIVVTEFYQ